MKEVIHFIKRYRNWIVVIVVVGSILYSLLHHRLSPTPSPAPLTSPSPKPAVVRTPLVETSINSVESPAASNSPSNSPPAIISFPLLFPDLDVTTHTLYYLDPNDNQLKKRDLTTNVETTIGELSAYVDFAVWSPDHQQLLLYFTNEQGNRVSNPLFQAEFPYGERIIGHYDLKTKRLDRLNQHIATLAWLGNDKIIYQYNEGRYNNLSISNPDGSAWRNIDTFTGEAAIISTGNSALVQASGNKEVRRFTASTTQATTFKTPDNFNLSQSSWDTTASQALYWAKSGNKIVINRFDGRTSHHLADYPTDVTDLLILWDNKTNDIYLASFDGLVKLSVKAE